MRQPLAKRVVAEALGTFFLLAAVVGSGIMAERLANGNTALALLANTVATGAALVALIIGFIHELDSKLSRESSRFESSVLRGLREREQLEAQHGWGRGFMTALTLGAQGLKWRSTSAGAAVRTIANATASLYVGDK